jgi:3-phosphoshikimate 1-carboxyvinyltransferase
VTHCRLNPTESLMDTLELAPQLAMNGDITLPGSKSISNRVLLLAALAHGTTEIRDVLDSDDTRYMLDALTTLGIAITRKPPARTVTVTGCGGEFPVKAADLFLGNAGTAVRPLTAALAMMDGRYRVDGVARMRERPIGDLVDGLRQLNARVHYEMADGFPPLLIESAALQVPDTIRVRGDVSSQFLSALLMALPLLNEPVSVRIEGELISKPYVELTINLLKRFGVRIQRDDWEAFAIPATHSYQSPGIIHVEGDASSASYFLAAGALARGPVTVQGVGTDSIQGDVKFAAALAAMGAAITSTANSLTATGTARLKGITLDANHIPDAAMTLAVCALFAEGPTWLTNIASWRVKETDRIAAMATELRKLGADIEEGADYLRITPPTTVRPNVAIDTYDDHRMAMCFSLVAAGGVPVRINDPQCVGKTFPTYFEEFTRLAA